MDINNKNPKIVLIGAGIMSATLGVFIKQLMPDAQIDIYERLNKVGAESSDAWNNAGTGHSSFCELNYTPEKEDGSIDIEKALRIGSSFEVSKQFWAFLKETGMVSTKNPFINDIDHMSFVWGDANVSFLNKRYQALKSYPLFEDMKYSQDHDEIRNWIPLLMNGRDQSQNIAATRMEIGTDVNFGGITRGMIQYLQTCDGVEVHLGHEIQDLTKINNGQWQIAITDLNDDENLITVADFVFIGAGGGALPLLEKTDLDIAKGYGGFPVSGQWLRCNNKEVIDQHEAKVYGKAEEGSPPMSVPHLDTRIINGEKCLLFGPYAGFSTKFLKNGSYWDLPLSIEVHNIWPMLSAGVNNIDLTKYLIEQVMQSPEDRFAMLKKYYPEAVFEDWKLEIAGQRVQIIKKDKAEGGVLKFGTEIVADEDGSMAALIGASPGASTSVSIMLDVLKICFSNEFKSQNWIEKIKKMIPSFGESLITNRDLCLKTRERTTSILKLE
jgi:malate dehydrogenase (quinone)